MTHEAPLDRSFLHRPVVEVAPELIGAILVGRGGAGRIVEVEAYGADDDPASHAHRGPTLRNRSMFGPAGHIYVYRSYGVHWCANVVCRDEGRASAVLLRALIPVRGRRAMRERRGRDRDRDLCSGPGKLCQALAITGEDDGEDLLDEQASVALRWDRSSASMARLRRGSRVGIRVGRSRAWRWWVDGEVCVSRGPIRYTIGC